MRILDATARLGSGERAVEFDAKPRAELLGVTYGASIVFPSGTVNIVLGTTAMNCGMPTATRPKDGTFVQIQISSAAKGIPATDVVAFDVISAGSGTGGGSGNGTVEVLDVSDSIITIRIACHDTVDGVAYAINGNFGVARCP